MSSDLIYQRCFNHALREAAARCPECGHFYCRECITEHNERVICATCLAKLAKLPLTQRAGFIGVVRLGQVVIGLVTACLFFYLCGRVLLSIDSSVHEGSIWKGQWLDSRGPRLTICYLRSAICYFPPLRPTDTPGASPSPLNGERARVRGEAVRLGSASDGRHIGKTPLLS